MEISISIILKVVEELLGRRTKFGGLVLKRSAWEELGLWRVVVVETKSR